MIAEHVSVEPTGRDPIDPILRVPVPLLVGDDERAIGIEADTVGCAKTGRKDVGPRAVFAHAKQRPVMRHDRRQRVASGFRVVEISGRVGLKAHREFVEVFGHLVVVVEILVEVRFAVTVEVVQDDDLIAAGDVDSVIDDLEAKRLEQAGGDALPEYRRRLAPRAVYPLTE
jgi:hypothetical protein